MNLLKETLEIMTNHNKALEDIECANVTNERNWDETIVLLRGEVTSLNSLNITYNSGYGSQEIFGWIAFKDHTWLERHEYDGSEWWEYKSCPGLEDLI